MGSSRRTLWAVDTAGFIFNVAFLLFALLVPLDAIRHHWSVATIGSLAALVGVTQLPGRILSGPLVDAKGERAVLRWTFGSGVLASGLVLGVPSVMAGLVGGQLGIGLARGLFWTAGQALVGRQAGDSARHLGFFTSATKAGAMVGLASAGLVAMRVGIDWGFGISGALNAIALILTWVIPPAVRAPRAPGLVHALAGLWPAARRPFVTANGFLSFLCAMPQALAQSIDPVYFMRLGVGSSWAALLTAFLSVGMIGAGFGAAPVLRRWGIRRTATVAGSLFVVSLAFLGMWPAVGAVTSAVFLGGVGAGLLNVVFLTDLVQQSPAGERGTNLGVAQIYFVLATMLAPDLAGHVAARWGFGWAWAGEGVVAVGVLGAYRIMTTWNGRWKSAA